MKTSNGMYESEKKNKGIVLSMIIEPLVQCPRTE